MDKRTFIGMVEAGEPLIQQAIDAMRRYHEAQDYGAPAEEVERLRLLAESLFQAVSDYQLRVMAKAALRHPLYLTSNTATAMCKGARVLSPFAQC